MRGVFVLWCLLFALGANASAQGWPQQLPVQGDFWDRTHLLAIEQGTALSRRARTLGEGGYTLAQGSELSLRKWYSTSWKDSSITLITRATKSFGIVWGFSTGERGEKYSIQPGLILGFVAVHELAKDLTLTARGSTLIGGRLREKSCIADYGEVGGVREVNCRLAATHLAPEETLKYLVNEGPRQGRIQVTLEWKF